MQTLNIRINTAILVFIAITGVAIVMMLATRSTAGPLDPPAAPGPTQRTQISSLPFSITAPGSYVVTADLSCICAGGMRGITLDSDLSGVTIDLNGFALSGGGAGSGRGIAAPTGPVFDVTIINGTVRNWGSDGIALSGAGFIYRDLHLVGNLGLGIVLEQSVADSIEAVGNGSTGIAMYYSTVTNCTSSFNTNGIQMQGSSTLTGCTAFSNTAHGIDLTGSGNAVSNVSVSDNALDGIHAGGTGGAIIASSIATSNQGDGIEVVIGSLVRDNVVRGNGQAGIRVAGTNNRIEANNALSNAKGIDVDATTGNTIIANRAGSNTTADYEIAGAPGANFVGTLVTTEAAMNAAPNSSVNIDQ